MKTPGLYPKPVQQGHRATDKAAFAEQSDIQNRHLRALAETFNCSSYLRDAVLGLVVGLVAALILARFVGSVLYGVTATDPVSIGAAVLIQGLTALLACLIPAAKASSRKQNHRSRKGCEDNSNRILNTAKHESRLQSLIARWKTE